MSGESAQEDPDCAVCLQKCYYPTQLPCGHIFCFLCVKGVAIQSRKCAMCRAEIPPDYLDHPVLLKKAEDGASEPNTEYQWYYEGRNGWWKYDEHSNAELETAFNSGNQECKLLLAGALYRIDFQNMMQVQSRDPTRRRRVKRDTPTLPAKGIAGIKITDNRCQEVTKSESEESPNNNHSTAGEVIEIPDDDEEEQPSFHANSTESSTIQDSSVSSLIERISSMDLLEQIPSESASREFSSSDETGV